MCELVNEHRGKGNAYPPALLPSRPPRPLAVYTYLVSLSNESTFIASICPPRRTWAVTSLGTRRQNVKYPRCKVVCEVVCKVCKVLVWKVSGVSVKNGIRVKCN